MDRNELTRVLQDVGLRVEVAEPDEVLPTIRARAAKARRRRFGAPLVLAAVLAVLMTVVLTADRGRPVRVATNDSAPATRTRLLVGNLWDGQGSARVIVLDVDSERTHTVALPDNNYGEYPTPLIATGQSFVFTAPGQAFASDLDSTKPPRSLGKALLTAPAMAADRVWMVSSWDASNMPLGLTQVSVDGGQTIAALQLPAEAGGWPGVIAELRSGLVLPLRDHRGIEVWDYKSKVARTTLTTLPDYVVAAVGDTLVWFETCADFPVQCRGLHITDAASGRDRRLPEQQGFPGTINGELSSDGHHLALMTLDGALRNPASRSQIRVIDLERGTSSTVPGSVDQNPFYPGDTAIRRHTIAWSPSGAWLFFGSDRRTRVSAYRLGADTSHQLALKTEPFSVLLSAAGAS